MSELKHTPLHGLHGELGAKLVPFAGYEMPVQYPLGVKKEHEHTRRACGLFDVSHMGQLLLHGPSPAEALETLVPADIVGLEQGWQRYALFTGEEGGILDDLMVVNAGDHLYLVVNAACQEQDIAHLRRGLSAGHEVEVLERGLLALQGPQAAEVMAR
ncbi:MAG: glycine cleavage system aminomethyltransferase GcvT, partial [Halomonas sp.]|nr:glycine cleavage system aminomethyltransferase GcvT [Halomonas sp.]